MKTLTQHFFSIIALVCVCFSLEAQSIEGQSIAQPIDDAIIGGGTIISGIEKDWTNLQEIVDEIITDNGSLEDDNDQEEIGDPKNLEQEFDHNLIQQSLLLYPNPVREKLTIQFSSTADHEILVYSMTGQMVWRAQVENTNLEQFDLSQLREGFYLVQLNTGDQVESRKLQIQK